MKKLLIVCLILVFASPVFAKLTKKDLGESANASAGAMLLILADVLSVHFSNYGIAYTPRFDGDKLVVTGVILDDSMYDDSYALKSLLKRQVKAFRDEMSDRVPLFVPSLKDKFAATQDISFVILDDGGDEVGSLKKYSWKWKPIRKRQFVRRTEDGFPIEGISVRGGRDISMKACPSCVGRKSRETKHNK